MVVNDEEEEQRIPRFLALDAAVLLCTTFKCSHCQVGGDYIKFVCRSDAGEVPKKEELVAVFKSCKCTRNARSRFNVEKHVRENLRLIESAFGRSWEEWRTRTVLVVENNLKICKRATSRLTPEESQMVITIGADNHLDVHGRSLSGFIADAPMLFAATLVKRR